MVGQWKDYAVKPFFDYDNFVANFKDIITDDENFDMHNNKGQFRIDPKWNIIVLYNNSGEFSDDDTVQMNIDEIVDCVGADVWAKW